MITIRVYGEPQPQGNKTAYRRGDKIVLVEGRRPEARAAFKDWRSAISAASRDWQTEHHAALLDEPVRVDLLFLLTKPSSLPKWRWLPWARPDIDKLVRAALDAITGTLITNDSRVVDLWARKRYAMSEPPGCSITVQPMGADERNSQQWPRQAIAS